MPHAEQLASAQAAGALGARHPDFVHSGDRRRALWLSGNAVPPEVHKVPRLQLLLPAPTSGLCVVVRMSNGAHDVCAHCHMSGTMD
jgi:hypothetical protein